MNLFNNGTNNNNTTFIPANTNLPEITMKAVLLSIILVVVLAAANAYLGLKVGTTVSASIPAAVISMGILRLFRKSNILENNIVQTAASSGEALVAGIAYILPALIILHYWNGFNYWETVIIALIGGILGVLFSVPLRRVLLEQKILRFPEGTAIGQVLKASASGGASLKNLVKGSAVGGVISFLQAGLQVISPSLSVWFRTSNNIVYGIGSGFDPALIAAGYIIGVSVAISVVVGVTIGWLVGIPILSYIYGIPAGVDAGTAAMAIWRSYIRYLGVGTMLVGGLWTLCTLLKPIIHGLYTSFQSLKAMRGANAPAILRTERDIPINYVFWGLLLILIPIAYLLYYFTTNSPLQLGNAFKFTLIFSGLLFIIIPGFLFAALGGYFAGLLGSTNSPGSALYIAALLLVSLIVLALFGLNPGFVPDASQRLAAAALAIIIVSFVSSAVVITNETIQDLKAGQIVGATPWKQQFMLILGSLVAALVIPLILQLLFNAYGIGGVFPHPGMDPNQMLAAPQAALMATLAQAVFEHQLPWAMLIAGAVIAVIFIAFDTWLKTKGMRLPVLAIGLGIYLPLEACVPLAFGGFASYIIEKILQRRYPATSDTNKAAVQEGKQRGLILACGMVAGAALMGVLLAIPFAIFQSTDVLRIAPAGFKPIADILAIIVTIGLLVWMGKIVVAKKP